MSQRRVTIVDVARVAKVSVGSVSRVLNGQKSVRANVRDKVLSVIDQLGYQRDTNAAALRSEKTKTIAIAIRDLDISVRASSVVAAEASLRQAGYKVIIATTHNDKRIELDLLREFNGRRVDGIIMTLSNEEDSDLRDAIAKVGVPVVLFGRDRLENIDSVSPDLYGGTFAAAEYLVSLGHVRIALITGPISVFPARSRIEAYRAALAAQKITCEEELIRTGSFSSDFGFAETMYLMGGTNPPTAILAGGMGMLPGILRALRMTKIPVGSGVSLIGGADSDLAELASPSVTTIAWDAAVAGRLAADVLLGRISGQRSTTAKMLIPTRLIVRGSCAPL